jgi:hypothetical protein
MVFLEKFTVVQTVKTFHAFMDSEGPLQCLGKPAIGPCPELLQSMLHPTFYSLKIHFHITLPYIYMYVGLWNGVFLILYIPAPHSAWFNNHSNNIT